jgi:hypothetical protein
MEDCGKVEVIADFESTDPYKVEIFMKENEDVFNFAQL